MMYGIVYYNWIIDYEIDSLKVSIVKNERKQLNLCKLKQMTITSIKITIGYLYRYKGFFVTKSYLSTCQWVPREADYS